VTVHLDCHPFNAAGQGKGRRRPIRLQFFHPRGPAVFTHEEDILAFTEGEEDPGHGLERRAPSFSLEDATPHKGETFAAPVYAEREKGETQWSWRSLLFHFTEKKVRKSYFPGGREKKKASLWPRKEVRSLVFLPLWEG